MIRDVTVAATTDHPIQDRLPNYCALHKPSVPDTTHARTADCAAILIPYLCCTGIVIDLPR